MLSSRFALGVGTVSLVAVATVGTAVLVTGASHQLVPPRAPGVEEAGPRFVAPPLVVPRVPGTPVAVPRPVVAVPVPVVPVAVPPQPAAPPPVLVPAVHVLPPPTVPVVVPPVAAPPVVPPPGPEPTPTPDVSGLVDHHDHGLHLGWLLGQGHHKDAPEHQGADHSDRG